LVVDFPPSNIESSPRRKPTRIKIPFSIEKLDLFRRKLENIENLVILIAHNQNH
jgi:hypothetical protein